MAAAFDHAPREWDVVLCDEPPSDAHVTVFGPDHETSRGVVFDPARRALSSTT